MTPEEEALASVDGLRSLLLEGKELKARVIQVLTGATVDRTIEGASTLTLDFHDDQQTLLTSGIFDSRVTTQVGKYSFELVQVRKTGFGLSCTFEDLVVAALRRHRDPIKVAPGKVTHVEFAKRLVNEEKWIKFHSPKNIPAIKTKVAITRGQPGGKGQKAEKESTWDALGRIADERGWRRFVRGKDTIWYVPETFLFEADPKYVLRENTDGVDFIDFDFDAGKDVATMTVNVRAKRWQIPVGTTVRVRDLGPANGKWLVTNISRSLFDVNAVVTLQQPRPTLPEPKPAPKPKPQSNEGQAAGNSGEGRSTRGGTSSEGYIWPAHGSITSGFGPRGSGFHTGTDIGVGTGTPVKASKSGTVSTAGWKGGDSYGNAVYIDHPDGSQTRYAHLDAFRCARGQWVEQGEVVGLSGSTGNSTGPHLHFEILIGGSPRNPLEYLP